MTAKELICACVESRDDAAWEEFVSRFRRPISLSIIRVNRQRYETPREVLDDLIQETYLKLCSEIVRLRDFAVVHPDSILGYIKTTAANVAHDHMKSCYAAKRGAGASEESLTNLDPESKEERLGGPAAIEREVLVRQIDGCLDSCLTGPDQQRDRLIFWLYYQQGMTAKAIATLPTFGLSTKGVESVILRLTRLVRERIVCLRTQNPTSGGTFGEGFPSPESY
jgi:RNA polymerase sigma-70 factor, ECF subfamily